MGDTFDLEYYRKRHKIKRLPETSAQESSSSLTSLDLARFRVSDVSPETAMRVFDLVETLIHEVQGARTLIPDDFS